jgi:hypothetical protein
MPMRKAAEIDANKTGCHLQYGGCENGEETDCSQISRDKIEFVELVCDANIGLHHGPMVTRVVRFHFQCHDLQTPRSTCTAALGTLPATF